MDIHSNDTQAASSTTWVVDHAFTVLPSIDCVINDGGVMTKAIPESIQQVSETQFSITWSTAQSGLVSMFGNVLS